MFLTSIMQRLGNKHRRQALQRRTRRPSIDLLEDRRLLATLFVDDDGAQKHNTDFTTIQAAVDAAHPGDTIRVSPGTYNESVTVDKKLTIIGAQDGADIHNGNAPNATNPSKASIVEVTGGEDGFHLTANDIVIRGFTIEDVVTPEPTSVGVNIDRQTSGDTIANNVIQNLTEGIYLNTNGAHQTTIQNNLIRNNNNPGAASGNGIYSDQGASNVLIAHNYFTGNTNASIIFVGGPGAATSQSNLTVKDNTMKNDAPMIFVNTSNSQISNNNVSNVSGSGIFLGGGDTNIVVGHNKLTGGPNSFTGVNLRFDPTDYNVVAPDSNIQITNNKISGFGDAGIRLREGTNHVVVKNNDVRQNGTAGGGLGGITLEGTGTSQNQVLNNHVEANNGAGILLSSSSGNTVSHNDVKKNSGDGISLQSATVNTVDHNNLDSNGADGIHADANSTGNTFDHNSAKNNALFDYEDDSAPGDNTWTKNKGKTASPPSLIAK